MARTLLKYVGDGQFIPGIPDRDLTEEDITATGMTITDVLRTGLYAPILEVGEKKMEQGETANKAVLKKYPNKERKS